MFKSVFGVHGLKWFGVLRVMSPVIRFSKLSRFDQVSFVVLTVLVSTLLTAFSGWLSFLILWVLPMFTLTFLLHHYRTVAEHLAVPATHELNASRTVVSSPLERFLVAPFGVNFHLEHHLFPGVPAYHLPSVHELLMGDEAFRCQARLTRCYLGRRGLWREIVHSNSAPEL
jgi:fatty acid desaturase